MEKIRSTQASQNLGLVFDQVQRGGPVMITRFNRDFVVIIAADDYKALVAKDTTGEQEASCDS